MQFFSLREFNKSPKTALSKLVRDGKAVLTSNGKPAAIIITVNAESFEKKLKLVQEVEKRSPKVRIQNLDTSENERAEAFERLMKFRRKKVPLDFNYKKELKGAIDERFGSIN
jgi:antitoxin (DNA-binding transcriptional repressor) of toxin-antitoxin stability system